MNDNFQFNFRSSFVASLGSAIASTPIDVIRVINSIYIYDINLV